LVNADIAFDQCLVQRSKVHGEWYAVHLDSAGCAIEHGQAGQESNAFAADSLQLLLCALCRPGLAENLLIQYGHLVGSDDQVVRVAGCHGSGFMFGQSTHQLLRTFS